MAKSTDVYVKHPSGRTAVYHVSPDDTILTICTKIAEEEKVKDNQVRLKYQGKILDRSHSMSYLGVRPETILKTEFLVPRAVSLTLTLPDGQGVTEMTSTSLDTVDSVIGRVSDLIKEDKSRVVLKFNGRGVRGDTLFDAGLVDGSALLVCVIATVQTCSGVVDEESMAEIDDHTKQTIVNSFVTDGKPVEVVFSFDTTGSMYQVLQQVQTKLKDCCTRLIQDIPNIRIGILAHGDYCDAESTYVIRILDLTSDIHAILDFVTETPRSGGCGPAACYEWVLRKAQSLDWSEDSAKALVIIGDEKPHAVDYTDARVIWREELNVLTGMGIKVYGVRALNASSAEPFYEEISDVSGGHYLRLSQFDIITDMFLAVCYRESQANANDALEAFAREVEEAGRMTEERRHMFQQLEKQQSYTDNEHTQNHNRLRVVERYVDNSWWDPALCSESEPTYHYEYDSDRDKDLWIPYREYKIRRGQGDTDIGSSTTSALSANDTSVRITGKRSRFSRKSRTRSKFSLRCSVM